MNNRTITMIVLLAIAMIIVPIASADDTVDASIEVTPLCTTTVFNEPAIRTVGHDLNYDLITVEGCGLTSDIGKPALPVKTVFVLIPADKEVEDVEIIASEPNILPGNYTIYPAQPPAMRDDIPDFVDPDQEVYRSDVPVPEKIGEFMQTVNFRGYKLALIKVHPVQYVPATGEVTYYSTVQLKLNLTHSDAPAYVSPKMPAFDSWIAENVLNLEAALEYEAPSPTTDYLIITREMFLSSAMALKSHKESAGLSVAIETVENITSTYPGRDSAEQIRNCIVEYYNASGIQWVLLMGDADPYTHYVIDTNWEVPTRYMYNPDYYTYTPTDYYYAGLDGDWDADGDSYFGESIYYSFMDEADWYPDVFVGRITATTTSEMDTQIGKLVNFANTTIDCFLMCGAVSDESTDEKQLKEYIRDNFVPPFVVTDELYESTGTLTEANVIDSINNLQPQIVNSAGHGSYTGLYPGPFFDTGTPTSITNHPYLWYAMACLAGGFDYDYGDCVGEAMMKDPDGSAIAWVGGTRVTWYWVGYPQHLLGLNGMQDWLFWEEFFNQTDYRPGTCLYNSKVSYLGYGPDLTMEGERKNLFAYQLLGDPEVLIGDVVPDETAPVITNVTAQNLTCGTARITWDTDELADGLVKYGNTSGIYTMEAYDDAMVTSHDIELTGLSAVTTYYFVVNSTDWSGNSNESAEYSFTTEEEPDIWVTPTEIYVNCGQGDVVNRTVTIGNDGNGTLAWEVTDIGGSQVSYMLQLPGGTEIPQDADVNVLTDSGYVSDPGELSVNAKILAEPIDVLLVAADESYAIQSMLLAFGDIDTVDQYDAGYGTPTLPELQGYDAVIVWPNYNFYDSVGLGNVLADYVDSSGRVILAGFCWYGDWSLGGRIMEPEYSPFTGLGDNHWSYADMGWYDPAHPIMDGVSSASDYYRDYVTLNDGAELVAEWDDGELFVGVQGSVSGVNSHIGDSYMWTGDIPLILHNALVCAAGVDWLSEFPTEGTVAPHDQTNVTATVDATDLEPGDYNATIRIASNDPDEPLENVSVYVTVLPPEIWVTPTAIEVMLAQNMTRNTTLTIGNDGNGTLLYEITDRTVSTLVSIPASDGNFSRGSGPDSIDRAPESVTPTEEPPVANGGEPAFAIDLYYDELVYIPDTTAPGTWDIVGTTYSGCFFAGDFLNGDFSKMYALSYFDNALYTVDTTTAAATPIGASVPVYGQDWTGMTGATDGTLYTSSTDIYTSNLYTIDPASGTPTVVGEITNAPGIIDIAINAAGEMYGVDIVNDVLVEIDPATGAGTVVGSLGFDACYAQGMDFEEGSGVLYLAAYNDYYGQGELRIADTNTGNTVLVGAFPYGDETDCLAFPTGGGYQWLTEYPTEGAVAPGEYDEVTVTINTTGLETGDYSADIIISNNDLDENPVIVPVNLSVVNGSMVSVEPDYLSAYVETDFTLNISVDPFGLDVYAGQFDLYFDPLLVEALEVVQGPFLSQDGASTFVVINEINNTIGRIRYAETRTGTYDGVTESGTLASIAFRAKDTAGLTDIDLDNVKLSFPDESAIPAITTDGEVLVQEYLPIPVIETNHTKNNAEFPSYFNCTKSWDPTLGGYITSYTIDFGDGANVTGSYLDVVEHTYDDALWWAGGYVPYNVTLTVTNNYNKTNSITGELMVWIAGDANGDGVVDIFDAVAIGRRWGAVNTEQAWGPLVLIWEPVYADRADVNNDDAVNVIDASIVGWYWDETA